MIAQVKEEKVKVINQFRLNDSDTGSAEVQVALLTKRINELNKHFAQFPKDYASRTGLMKLVGRRRRLLRYLESKDAASCVALIKQLGLR